MSKVKITGNASGTGVLTVTAPNTSTDRTITLPDSTGTLATTGDVPAGISSSADATAITINSSEQVGIGKTPVNTLDVNHSGGAIVKLWRDSSSGYLQFDTDGTNSHIKNGGGPIKFKTGGDTVRASVTDNGITFGTDTAAANALDDYEEGTYTPVFKDSSNASMTGTLVNAIYTKIGRLVHVMVYYVIGDSQNGNLNTMTLPFNQTGSGRGAGSITTYNCPHANESNDIYLNGGSKVAFWQVRNNATSLTMAVDNGSELILSITYMAS